MPNILAYLVLVSFPVVVFFLFRSMKVSHAVAWTILIGYLFLPQRAGFDFPLVPRLDKDGIPALFAMVCAMIFARKGLTKSWRTRRNETRESWMPKSAWGWFPMILLGVGAFGTALTNDDVLAVGGTVLTNLRTHDALSILGKSVLSVLPFLLARRYLSSPEGNKILVKAFLLISLSYVALSFVEIRLSPQLNVWVYGFRTSTFLQQVRFGGYRPVAFLNHSLWVTSFLAMSFVMIACMVRSSPEYKKPFWYGACGALFVCLILAKGVAAILYGVPLAMLAIFGLRMRVFIAAMIAVVVISFPMLRGADLAPVRSVQSMAQQISPERAASLRVRLDNEDQLLNRANRRPLFGWGGWGRSRILDADFGNDTTIADSQWIIVIGNAGWVGYIGEFGLVCFPLWMLWRRRNQLELTPEASALAMALAANLTDMLVNSTMTPLTFLLAGAVFGFAERADMAPARKARRRPSQTGPPAEEAVA